MAQPRSCHSTNHQAETLRLRRLRESLKRATGTLERFCYRLEALHADRTGAFRMVYPRVPLIPDEYVWAERALRRTERAAAIGCPLTIMWMEETATLRGKIEALRMTPLPEKDPTYTGPMGMPVRALSVGKRRSPYFQKKTPEDLQAIAAAHMERVAGRKARGRALLEEFLREQATATESPE